MREGRPIEEGEKKIKMLNNIDVSGQGLFVLDRT